MVMVIVLHTNTYGLSGITFDITDKFYWITSSLHTLSLVAVNCFVLISGYFSSATVLRINKLVKLWVFAAIFSVGLYLLLCLIPSTEFQLSLSDILVNVFPVLSNRYWFFTCYGVMILLSPFINKFIDSLEQKSFKKLLAILLGLFVVIPTINIFGDVFDTSNGFSAVWFIVLYFVAAYIRRYPLPKLPYGFLYLGISLLSLSGSAILNYGSRYFDICRQASSIFGRYNSAFVFLGAVFLFLFFLNHPLKAKGLFGKFISNISACVFGVYLLHEHPMLRNILWNDVIRLKDTTSNLWEYCVRLVISIVVIFVVGVVAGFVITQIINVIEKLIMKIIKKK